LFPYWLGSFAYPRRSKNERNAVTGAICHDERFCVLVGSSANRKLASYPIKEESNFRVARNSPGNSEIGLLLFPLERSLSDLTILHQLISETSRLCETLYRTMPSQAMISN
jgi:hypothetical protein